MATAAAMSSTPHILIHSAAISEVLTLKTFPSTRCHNMIHWRVAGELKGLGRPDFVEWCSVSDSICSTALVPDRLFAAGVLGPSIELITISHPKTPRPANEYTRKRHDATISYRRKCPKEPEDRFPFSVTRAVCGNFEIPHFGPTLLFLCLSVRHLFLPRLLITPHSFRTDSTVSHYRERKFADTTGTVLVPWAGHFQ